MRWKIVGFIEGGNNFTECGKFYNIDPSTARRIYWKYKDTGDVADKKRSGKPNKVEEEEKKIIVNELENKHENTRKIGLMHNISHQTVIQIAHEDDLLYKIPKIIPKLTSSHIKLRYEFCQFYQNKDNSKWFYCDESAFELFRNTIGVWTHDKHPTLPMQKSKQKLTVWAAIGKKGKTKICILTQGETIDKARYMQILEEYFLPAVKLFFPDNSFCLYQDNAPPHVAKDVRTWMKDTIPNVIKAPPNSPDLNPIEMIWAILKQKVEKRNVNSIEELKVAIEEEWENIEQSKINHCIEHVEKRLKYVYENEGEF